MQPFEQLDVWKEAHAWLLGVYRETCRLPSDERYGLSSQLRRAALSVPTNIVEGSRRLSQLDYARLLNVAEASLAEARYLLGVCVDLAYLPADAVGPLLASAARVGRKLYALRGAVTASSSRSERDPAASPDREPETGDLDNLSVSRPDVAPEAPPPDGRTCALPDAGGRRPLPDARNRGRAR